MFQYAARDDAVYSFEIDFCRKWMSEIQIAVRFWCSRSILFSDGKRSTGCKICFQDFKTSGLLLNVFLNLMLLIINFGRCVNLVFLKLVFIIFPNILSKYLFIIYAPINFSKTSELIVSSR